MGGSVAYLRDVGAPVSGGANVTQVQFLRIKKLTGKGIVLKAAKHNLREIAAEIGAQKHIDPSRIGNNIVLHGAVTAEGVAQAAQVIMEEANVRPLKVNAVRALEVIFSLPADTSTDQRKFFSDATQWVVEHFGVPLLSSVIHSDEEAPHCHVLLLPLVDSRMVGSDLMGGRSKLQGHQAAFQDNVGKMYGLSRAPPKKLYSASVRRAAIELAYRALEANSGLHGSLLRVLLGPHTTDPEPLLTALRLAMPAPKVTGSFVATMTKPMKKDKPIGNHQQPYRDRGND